MEHCTEERFLKNVAKHEMTILKDEGVYRHIRFKEPGTINAYFDLITWPGSLCYTGDMGTYVFERLEDMFTFFRKEKSYKLKEKKLFINPGYWGEKLQSIERNGGYREFDGDAFRERVKHQFDTHWEDSENVRAKEECWEEIESDVLCCADEEHMAYRSVSDFSFSSTDDPREGFYFQDFFDGGGTDKYTCRYLWCCYALAWAVAKYDDEKK